MPAMPAEVAVVLRRPVTDRFEAVGTIEAEKAVALVSEIDGTVVSIPFREGEAIGAGELVARLDDSQLAAEVDRAKATLAQRRTTYERVKSIVEQEAFAPQELDNAAAALGVAEAELALARARLAKTRILAPFDGTVGARRVSPGAFLRSGEPIADLAQIDEIRVHFSLPERYLPRLEQGSGVTVATTAYPGYALTGMVYVIEPVLDPITRSARVVARVQNPERRFRPGMSANVSAVLSVHEDALTIPSEAVFLNGDQTFAYVVMPDSTVTRRALRLGTRLPDAVEVVDGLGPGMRVVRAGHQKLFEGAKVLPILSGEATGSQGDGPGSGEVSR